MSRALLCVVTGRYLPMALSMAASYARFHPADVVRILLVDVSSAAIARAALSLPQGLRVDGIDVLDQARTARIRRYYDAVEMIGATRSPYTRHVMEREDVDEIVMLDADIQCYRELTPFFEATKTAPIALTPHVTSAVPDDGALPDDLEFIRDGFINNGARAMRRSGLAAPLAWLEAKVEKSCFFCPEINLYNEQTWVSFLPWYFPDQVHLVRHPGMNVAYWNLYERTLRDESGSCTVNGLPLFFFHFSGYDRTYPKLTMHSVRQGDAESTRVITALLKEYDDALTRAYATFPQIPGDIPCSTLSLGRRLRVYRSIWGGDPSFVGEYRRFGRPRLRRRLRALANRLTARS